MAVNKSVLAFRQLTRDMQQEVFDDALAELNSQATGLVNMMRQVVKHGPTGDLAASIRQEPGRKQTVIVVKAGGASTTRQGGGGKSYDYARAVEFGTEHVPAQPFFFPTFRLMRKRMRSAMRSKITKTIKQYSAK